MIRITKMITPLIVSLVMLSGTVSAQESHLTFCDVPINGREESFVAKLKARGFSYSESYDNVTILEGMFEGKKVEVTVASMIYGDSVWYVDVTYPENSTWRSLKAAYLQCVESFIKKYGKPTCRIEYFAVPWTNYDGIGYELSAILSGYCHYQTIFVLPQGMINIEINQEARIVVHFEDAINSKKYSHQK